MCLGVFKFFFHYFDVFGLHTIMFYNLLMRITKAIMVGLYYNIGYGLMPFILIGDVTQYRDPILAMYSAFFPAFKGFDMNVL